MTLSRRDFLKSTAIIPAVALLPAASMAFETRTGGITKDSIQDALTLMPQLDIAPKPILVCPHYVRVNHRGFMELAFGYGAYLDIEGFDILHRCTGGKIEQHPSTARQARILSKTGWFQRLETIVRIDKVIGIPERVQAFFDKLAQVGNDTSLMFNWCDYTTPRLNELYDFKTVYVENVVVTSIGQLYTYKNENDQWVSELHDVELISPKFATLPPE